MIQTIQLTPGVVLRHYPDNRFKTAVLSVQLQRPLCREEASLNALLFSVLLRGTAKNPDMRAITARLDGLYGAAVNPLMRRIGDRQTIGLFLSCLEDRFALPGDQVLAPSLDMVREILLEPKLVSGIFDPEFVESEKKNLIADIESELNDKRSYAAVQMLRSMCAGDSFALSLRGEKADVEAITAQSLFAHYRKILAESPVHVFYIGSAQPETVAEVLKPMLSKLAKNPILLPAQTGFAPVPFSEHEEILDVAQGKLCLGYATPINLRHPDYPAVQVCNTILGAGMTSKLFMQVREKMSLCYDIGSGFHGSKGIMTVAAGIEFEKKEIVQQEIFHQLQEICEGNITSEELTAAKEALLSTHDSPGAIEGYYASAAISGIGMTPAEFMDAIANVTIDNVAAAAKTLSLQTVYFLKGDA